MRSRFEFQQISAKRPAAKLCKAQEKSGAKIDLDKVRHRKREQCATRRGTMTTVTTDNDDDGSGDNDDDSNDDDDYDDDDDKGH